MALQQVPRERGRAPPSPHAERLLRSVARPASVRGGGGSDRAMAKQDFAVAGRSKQVHFAYLLLWEYSKL